MSPSQPAHTLFLGFPEPTISLGQAEPTLWVRLLRLWHDFSDDDPTRGRTIAFGRGLNIVTSPADPRDDQISAGHAAGKTLLCRQIRYCLGEDSFADSDDTAAIRRRFPNGGVGAEVRVNGETWVVRRPFAARGYDIGFRGESFSAAADAPYGDSFEAFLEAIERVAFADAHRDILASLADIKEPWQYLLAWLTRDQECRLEGLTHWRHADSSSNSPVRKASAENRLTVLRMVVGLYSRGSSEMRLEASASADRLAAAQAELVDAELRYKILRLELARALGMSEGDVWPPLTTGGGALFDEAGAERDRVRALVAKVDSRIRSVSPVVSSALQVAAEDLLQSVQADLGELDERIHHVRLDLEMLQNHRQMTSLASAEAEAALRRAKHPTCPYDGAQIDVEASKVKCPLVKFDDEHEARREARAQEKHRKHVVAQLNATRETQADLKKRRAQLKAQRGSLTRTIKAHEDAAAQSAVESQAAWATKGTLRSFLEAVRQLDRARAEDAEARAADKNVLERKNEHLSTYSTSGLTKWFNLLVRKIVADQASGRVSLDGRGMQADIEFHGLRRSVALNSLRVVLFDLAAMFYSAEGCSKAPAFLLHDSPREGDLDPWTYARLFETVLALGPDEKTAPFQYIVTTTTEPPDCVRSRIREKLSARTSELRYFREDL